MTCSDDMYALIEPRRFDRKKHRENQDGEQQQDQKQKTKRLKRREERGQRLAMGLKAAALPRVISGVFYWE